METRFAIKPPESLSVIIELTKSGPVELVFEKHIYRDDYTFKLIEELITAPAVSIPVTINPDTLPYFLLTKMDEQFIVPGSATLSIRVIDKRNIKINLKNLEFLKNVFGEDVSMKLILSHYGDLASWQTEEMCIHENGNDVEASVCISEDVDWLIREYGRRKRYRTAHGEVSSVTGYFTIQATWRITPRPQSIDLSKKFERHQNFISTKSFDHTVELLASNGKVLKVSKAVLAAFSEKIEKQLQFLLDENSDARTYKAIKIFSGSKCKNGDDHYLNEDRLWALVRFITMNSIAEPLKNPALSLELLMTASYNMITELENAMALILLAQPVELFAAETSAYLYWFSSIKVEMYRENEKLMQFWKRVKIRACWNMKWKSKEELNACEVFQDLFPDELSRELFFSSL